MGSLGTKGDLVHQPPIVLNSWSGHFHNSTVTGTTGPKYLCGHFQVFTALNEAEFPRAVPWTLCSFLTQSEKLNLFVLTVFF